MSSRVTPPVARFGHIQALQAFAGNRVAQRFVAAAGKSLQREDDPLADFPPNPLAGVFDLQDAPEMPPNPLAGAYNHQGEALAFHIPHAQRGEEVMPDALTAWILENVSELIPPTVDSTPALVTMRRLMLARAIQQDPRTKTWGDIVRFKDVVVSAGQLGVEKGEWKKRGTCELAVKGLGGGFMELKSHPHLSSINWNHFIPVVGNSRGSHINDPTWKQFFPNSDTKSCPAIFNGTVEAFWALNLDVNEKIQYLMYSGHRRFVDRKLAEEPRSAPQIDATSGGGNNNNNNNN